MELLEISSSVIERLSAFDIVKPDYCGDNCVSF